MVLFAFLIFQDCLNLLILDEFCLLNFDNDIIDHSLLLINFILYLIELFKLLPVFLDKIVNTKGIQVITGYNRS